MILTPENIKVPYEVQIWTDPCYIQIREKFTVEDLTIYLLRRKKLILRSKYNSWVKFGY